MLLLLLFKRAQLRTKIAGGAVLLLCFLSDSKLVILELLGAAGDFCHALSWLVPHEFVVFIVTLFKIATCIGQFAVAFSLVVVEGAQVDVTLAPRILAGAV